MKKPNRGIINNAFFTKSRKKKPSKLFIGREQQSNVEVFEGIRGKDDETILILKERR